MNRERNIEIRKYFKSDDAILEARSKLGRSPIYINVLANIIIEERIFAELTPHLTLKELKLIAKKHGISIGKVYMLRKLWLRGTN